MLALIGTVTVLVLLAVIMLNWVSPLVALIAVPTIASLVAGFGLGTSKFMIAGITSIAPVAGMFVFAILYFGIMTDAGMLDPIISRILAAVGRKPTRIVMGTALLALLIHLDGSGAVCFLITIPAMIPIYDELGMDRRILACAASLAAGVNFLPWTGPTLRAAAALKLTVTESAGGSANAKSVASVCRLRSTVRPYPVYPRCANSPPRKPRCAVRTCFGSTCC
jgi:CitMHS family citrate-Mg2+:H+ or citrate-Ca2+:H+ symporter